MSIPSRETVRRRIREVRALINKTDDPVACRIAQGIEDALRWTCEDTVGWNSPANNARQLAAILRKDLKL